MMLQSNMSRAILTRSDQSSNQISLANFFIYNTDFGQKEGREAEKIFYYYPPDEKLARQIRLVGFCAGVVQFTQTFKASRPCEYVHTEKIRFIFHQIDGNFWMVMGLNVPQTSSNKSYDNDQISDQIYMALLKQINNLYRLFNGSIAERLEELGHVRLRENLKAYFDNYIEKKLNVQDCDILSTFNGIQFMSLDRNMYLRIQCLLNYLEEKVDNVDRIVVMHNDQLIWSGLEQDDISLIYPYLRELVLNNSAPQQSSTQLARFLVDDSIQSRLSRIKATTSSQANQLADNTEEFFEFERVHLEKPQPATYYLIPYNLSRLTFFIFIRVSRSFKLSLLKTIDDLLAPHMIEFAAEIADQQSKRNLISQEEKEIKYIYFNRFNLAQKTTVTNSKEFPKYIMNLISQLSKDLESCSPSGEIIVKSSKEYWIACKKSDLREVYVIVCQKNANLTLIDEEVKQLCSTNFSNIFFME